MTLFSLISEKHSVFQAVLAKFFGGEQDPKTLSLIRNNRDFYGSI
jgi:uncharacterized protein (DUF1810 family)